MALTEEERKLLAELEQNFAADDPKLATKLAQPVQQRSVHPAKAVVGVLGVIVGLIALVVGISVHWIVSVIGFVIMLGSVILLLSAWSPSKKGPGKKGPGKPAAQPKPPSSGDFMSRMESRWQNRQEG